MIICLGVAVQDVVFSVEALPVTEGKYAARSLALAGGGMAASAASAIARLGGQVELWTRLGADTIGDEIVRELESFGVGTSGCRRFTGHTSGLSAVLVDERGERLIVNHSDASLDEAPDWLALDAIANCEAVLVDTTWTRGAIAVLEAARAAAVPAVLDADKVPRSPRLVELASHAVFSRSALAGQAGCSAIEDGLRRVARDGDGAGVVAVTCGGDGAYWLADGVLEHAPAFDVDVVDTLGAGDVFHGALALALAEGRRLDAAMRFASAAAALKCTRFGGRAGVPTRAEVEALLTTATD